MRYFALVGFDRVCGVVVPSFLSDSVARRVWMKETRELFVALLFAI